MFFVARGEEICEEKNRDKKVLHRCVVINLHRRRRRQQQQQQQQQLFVLPQMNRFQLTDRQREKVDDEKN